MSGRPARILFVNNSADIYGASRLLLRTCNELDRRFFEPIVLLPEQGPLVPLLEECGIPFIVQRKLSVITRGVFKSWRFVPFLLNIPIAAWQLRDIIRQHQIDLVHTNVGTALSSALGARIAAVPHVWHIRDWYGEFGSLWKWYRRYILSCSARVLCVSRAIADQFGASTKVEVVHDGFPVEELAVDDTILPAEFRRKYEIRSDEFVVACIGRIKFVRKGQEFLVQAAKILKDRNVAIKLLIVGSPSPGSEDHLPRLKELITSLGLEDRVVFTGELPDVRSAYAACDVVALPSAQPEPFGGVVIEAMCASKPVVATALGGSLDQVADGETGFLVPPKNPDAFAEKIRLLCEDSALRQQMGRAGMERARTYFGVRQMMEKIEANYHAILAR